MILVSRGPVRAFCVFHSASSGSEWYALFTLMRWIQRVTPSTLSAVGLVRTTVYMDPSTVGKGVVCPVLDHTWSPHTNSWTCSPRGMAAFLYKLSDLIDFVTQLFHQLWNLFSPYLRQVCWHLSYCGSGPPRHNYIRRGAMGLWRHPESKQSPGSETSPPRNSQCLRPTWRVSL